MTIQELNRLHATRRAKPNKTYTLDNGDVYIGTLEGRVKRVIAGDEVDLSDIESSLSVLNSRITTTAAGAIQSVTDDGGGIVTVDNTDPLNPIVGFSGTFVETLTDDSNGLVVVDNTDPVNPIITLEGFPVTTQTADFTLALTDRFSIIEVDTRTTVDITIPANGTIAFPIGTIIKVVTLNTGITKFVAAGGVTINSLDSYVNIKSPGGAVWLTKTDTNVWYLDGDLEYDFDPDAKAFIVAANVLEPYIQIAFDDLILDWKANNIFTKMVGAYPFYGGNPLRAKVNMVNPGTFDLTFTASPSFTYNGMSVNGTTQYASSGIIPTTHLTQDDTHAFFSKRNNSNAGVELGSEAPAASGFVCAARQAGDTYNIMYQFPGNSIQVASASAIGKWCFTRTTNIVQKTFKDNVQQGATDTTASAGWANLIYPLYIGATNSTGVTANFCLSDFDFVTIGAGLSDADVTALTNSITTFNTAIGR